MCCMEALLSQRIRIAAFFHAEHVEPTKTFSTQGQWFSGQHPSEQRRSGMIFKSHFTGKKKKIYMYIRISLRTGTKLTWSFYLTSSILLKTCGALLVLLFISELHYWPNPSVVPCSHSDFIVDSEYRNWPHFKWCLVRRCWTATKGHSHQSGTSLK